MKHSSRHFTQQNAKLIRQVIESEAEKQIDLNSLKRLEGKMREELSVDWDFIDKVCDARQFQINFLIVSKAQRNFQLNFHRKELE